MEKTSRKNSVQEKRRIILNSAVSVFAQKGFHSCRISDIATQAGVAYGLVYHYFQNKEEILNTIFDENWGLLTKVIETVKEQPVDLHEKLRAIVSLIFDAYRLFPDILQVMVIEIARSSKFLKKPKIDAFECAFVRLADIFSEHQKAGEISSELDAKFLAYGFFGMIELVLTGYLLGTLVPETDAIQKKNEENMVKIFLEGLRQTNQSSFLP